MADILTRLDILLHYVLKEIIPHLNIPNFEEDAVQQVNPLLDTWQAVCTSFGLDTRYELPNTPYTTENQDMARLIGKLIDAKDNILSIPEEVRSLFLTCLCDKLKKDIPACLKCFRECSAQFPRLNSQKTCKSAVENLTNALKSQ